MGGRESRQKYFAEDADSCKDSTRGAAEMLAAALRAPTEKGGM